MRSLINKIQVNNPNQPPMSTGKSAKMSKMSGRTKENPLKKTREALLMSKAELARAAEVSPITITRIENGLPCRLATKRKIILALGLELSDKDKIFKD